MVNQPAYQPSYPAAPNQKPGLVMTIAIMTLVNGILNIFWALGAGVTLIASLVGIVCLPFAAYPIVLGILEIIYAARLLANSPQPVRPAKYLAIMEICDIVLLDVPSLVVGILALIFYNDPTVQAYFADLNSQPPARPYPGHPQQ